VVRTNVGAGSRRAIEERIVHSHDWETGVATLRTDLQYGVVGETIEYELVPIWLGSIADAVAADAAMSVGTGLRVTQAHQQALAIQYRKAIKTTQDTFGNMQGRMTKFFDDRNVDNSDREYAWAYKFTYGY
jgi:glycogen synthase